MTIPKLIMQTWKTRNVPKEWKESIESIKKFCPKWKHVLLTDKDNNDFVKHYFPDFWPYYSSFKHKIQKVDSVRYMWLYIYGGLYIDLDYALMDSIDDDFESYHDLFFVYSGNINWCITNSLLASKPKCDFWLKVLEELKEPPPIWCITKHLEVMNTTGPIMLNYCVRKYGNDYNIRILDEDLYGTCTVCDTKPYYCKGSKVKILKGLSWCSWDTRLFNWIFCKIYYILIVLIVIFISVVTIFTYKIQL